MKNIHNRRFDGCEILEKQISACLFTIRDLVGSSVGVHEVLVCSLQLTLPERGTLSASSILLLQNL